MEHEFFLRVRVKTDENNPNPDPEDFAYFLNERFTVKPDATYGLDAYNKHAPQLILEVESYDVGALDMLRGRIIALIENAERQEQASLSRDFNGNPFPWHITKADLRAAIEEGTNRG